MKLKQKIQSFKARWKHWGHRLKELSQPISDVIRNKHRFVVIDNETLKEKLSFQLSGINIFVAVGVGMIVLILLTTFLIAFTPLREYIPGYTNEEMVEQSYRNEQVIDSLSHELENQNRMLNTIKAIILDESINEENILPQQDSVMQLNPVHYVHSRADSLLRREVETKFNFKL